MNVTCTRKPSTVGRRSFTAGSRAARGGLTLVEIIIAITLSAMLITSAVTVFSVMGEGIGEAQATLETADRLRSAAAQLERDLCGITVDMIPPVMHGGYFELVEGPETTPASGAIATGAAGADSTVGDVDDFIMFTTQNYTVPFVGRVNGRTVTSNVAEVVWFLRGTNLYRRVLLVKPSLSDVRNLGATGYYLNNDVSVHVSGGGGLEANSLDDLTRRENRFAHDATAYPFSANWGTARLPTLGDSGNFTVGQTGGATTVNYPLDFWKQPFQENTNPTDGNSDRAREDIILTNVLMFDIKVWDPAANGGAGAFVDLGSGNGVFKSANIDPRSQLGGPPYVYDTWCLGYESDGISQNPNFSENGADGFDNDSMNGADDPGEWETSPPFPYPLRGIQIRIRTFEPSSLSIQEVTVGADFVQ